MKQDKDTEESFSERIAKCKEDISNTYRELINNYPELEAYRVQEYWQRLLEKLAKLVSAPKGISIFFNRHREEFEEEIEYIATNGLSKDFKWWGKKKNSFIPSACKACEIEFPLDFFPMTHLQSLDRFKKDLLQAIESRDKPKVNAQIEKIYDGFSPNLLFLLLGSYKDLDILYILSFPHKDLYLRHKWDFEDLCAFLTMQNSDLCYRIRITRHKFVEHILEEISQVEDDEKLLEKIGETIYKYYKDPSEIGIFLRYADYISPKAELLYGPNQDYVDKKIRSPIRIGQKKTRIAQVAKTQEPFYCKFSDPREDPHYEAVVRETKSQYTIPLVYKKELVGVLNIGVKYRFGFLPADRRALDILASHISSEIHQNRTILNFRAVAHMAIDNLIALPKSIDYLTNTLQEENGVEKSVRWLFDTFKSTYKALNDSMYLVRPFCFATFDANQALMNALNNKTAKMSLEELRKRGLTSNEIIQNKIPPEKPISVVFNENILTAIFLNIIINAIRACELEQAKRGKSYKPQIVISAFAEVPKRIKRVVLEFKDNGIRIAESDLRKLFEPRFKVDTRALGPHIEEERLTSSKAKEEFEVRRIGGLGIGLWIADQLLAKSGGLLSFDHRGEFKWFRVHLPQG